MKNPCTYIRNAFRVVYWKIKYSRCVSISFFQSFEKVRIEIKKDGSLKIGGFNQNREFLYLGVVGGNLDIGNHCFFNINSSITCFEKILIGDNCKFGNNLVIVDHDHNIRSKHPEFISAPITIGNNVWVGANVTILRGSHIGDNCVIAAGSTIKGNIPKNTIFINGTLKERRTE